ncbi:hypothetical protein KSF73_05105 [Burkholderiaceae bacterium DAT-1]|nr:hypothetical protein [Burkholderiaceae bacterium DAT-1]
MNEKYFVILNAFRPWKITDAAFLQQLAKQSPAWVACTGTFAREWEDAMDDALLETFEAPLTVTSAHPNETLDDVRDFAVVWCRTNHLPPLIRVEDITEA